MNRFFYGHDQGLTPAIFSASPGMALARTATCVPPAIIHMARQQASIPNGLNFAHPNVLAVGRSANQDCAYSWMDASGCR